MRLLIQRLALKLHGACGTTFVVGAGVGTDLPAWRNLGSERLVVAEAHAPQAEELARYTERSTGEEVWPFAVVELPTEHVTLQILNNPIYNSLKLPGDLVEHYPNLRVVDQIEVRARSLGESIEKLALDGDHPHVLVLDAPGQSAGLLAETPDHLLQLFTWIAIRCDVEPLYQDDKGLNDTTRLLRSLGFDVELDDPNAIYPHTALLLKRNDTRVRIVQLETQLQTRNAEYTAQVGLVLDSNTQVHQLIKQSKEQTRLAYECKANLDKLTQQHAEQNKRVASHQAQIQTLIQERDQQIASASEMNCLAIENKQKQNLLIQKLTLAEVQIQSTELREAALQEDLTTANQTTSLSIRLQAMLEADLNDLQDRYRTLLHRYEEQHQLLTQLGEKLGVASNYLHRLESDAAATPTLQESVSQPQQIETHTDLP